MNILLVEDSDDDLFFFKRLLSKAGIRNPLSIATDGQQAVLHLDRALHGPEATRPKIPDVIFLDLKLPLRGGFEVLQWIRARSELARTVVVILSSSGEARDVVQAFEWGAQGYLVKYPEPAVFSDILQRVAQLESSVPLSALQLPGIKRP